MEKLEAHCILSRSFIADLLKQANRKERKKKKSSVREKKPTGEAMVLTSAEGLQELLQLREESQQKERRQNEELDRKTAEDKARRECEADLTHTTFTGPLNKSRRKEELANIAAALSLSDSGKKDDIYGRIIEEFEANPQLKTNTQFEGLFHSRPRKRARVDGNTEPSMHRTSPVHPLPATLS